MASLGRTAIGAILVSVIIVFLSKLAALFPFYMTMVTETFNLANIAAADNYIKFQYYDASINDVTGLRSRPLFNQNPWQVEIEVLNEDRESALGNDSEFYYIGEDDYNKPYRQRGKPITIIIRALYPFQFELWGRPVGFDVPVSFSLTTIGLKYYKDLPMDDPY